MGIRFGWLGPVAFVGIALVVGCGGGGSGGSGTPAGPRPSSSATASPSSTLRPTPSPTPTGIGAACVSTANPLPGTYAVIATTGNVVGTTYTQNAGGGTWNANAYSVVATPVPTAYPTPSPSPTPTPTPTATLDAPKHKHTPKPTMAPTPTPTPSPTVVPTATPVRTTYISYSGSYVVAGFSGTGPGGPFSVNPTTGCFALLATQDGQPIQPGGNANASAKGVPFFGTFVKVNAVALGSGNITSFTVSKLGPSSGSGTFTLDNNATGTVTIQASQVVSLDRFRRLLERQSVTRNLGAEDGR